MTGIRFLCAFIVLPPIMLGQEAASPLDLLGIQVPDTSREFSYTNKRNAFFYGETHGKHTDPWQGFHLSRRKVLDDYSILVDGEELPRNEAVRVTVYPDYLERVYPNGMREQLRLVDSLAIIAIHFLSPVPVEVAIIPWVTGIREGGDHSMQLVDEAAWIDIPSTPSTSLALHGKGLIAINRSSHEQGRHSEILVISPKKKQHSIAIAASAEGHEAALRLAALYGDSPVRFARERRERMERLLTLTSVETSDTAFNTALSWAKLSLDALIMNDGRPGIYAGLPWFSNYWGRDTFIALPGALLVTGHFSEAKEILRTFVAAQETETSSTNYGRIPNFINPGEVSYNTADATPRFAIMAREYIERSGDSLFLAEIYPSILRANDGTIRFHMDSLGFLSHEDAETWMDAVGPDGPWSPRGNRANDIQALWSAQLEAGIWFASQVGDATSAQSWQAVHQRLNGNFRSSFLADGQVADHLNRDGSRDHQVRPNQIFTTALLPERERAAVVTRVLQELTYPYGVASLSQSDPGFHPYHIHPPHYPKDAAYHNGTVWTWLQGRLISELCTFDREDIAVQLTQNTVHQILHRGAVGTQSELLDAVPDAITGEPRLSGTFSQAWNLAEFIRNFYDDYLGVRIRRYDHVLTLKPRIPDRFGNVRANINLDGRSVLIEIRRTQEILDITIDAVNLRKKGRGEITVPLPGSGESARIDIDIIPGKRIMLSASKAGVLLISDGEPEILRHTSVPVLSGLLPANLRFAVPSSAEKLPILTPPSHVLLSHNRVKEMNPAGTMYVSAVDPEGDDRGTGAFTYPTHPAHAEGSFDLTGFNVSFDSQNLYFTLKFRSLSNPGWHPQYGFQLTYAAIAIDSDNKPRETVSSIGHNALFALPRDFHPERVILVGGGLQIEDGDGKILAVYSPAPEDVSAPLGNSDLGTVSFSVPRDIMGPLNPDWKFIVLTGGQDDHGGAGLGEFRSVQKQGGEWYGGGKESDDEPNIYDTLVYPPDRNR